MLYDQTAIKNARRHPDVRAGDYGLINEILANGEIIEDGARSLIIQSHIDGKLWRVVVKATADRQELFMTTFHRISETHRKRILKSKK